MFGIVSLLSPVISDNESRGKKPDARSLPLPRTENDDSVPGRAREEPTIYLAVLRSSAFRHRSGYEEITACALSLRDTLERKALPEVENPSRTASESNPRLSADSANPTAESRPQSFSVPLCDRETLPIRAPLSLL